MATIFDNLSYATPRPTYVSPPLAYMHETLQAQEDKYFKNLDTATQLEIALKNMEVDAHDQPIKNNAILQLDSTLKGIRDAGDWENASMLVRSATKDVAVNSGLQAALQRRADRLDKEAKLEALVGKPPEEGGITRSDFEREREKAMAVNGPTQPDANGNWNSQWNIYTPPAAWNLGKIADDFLKDYKPDTLLGNLVKKEDGKWYKVTEFPKTPDNAAWLDRATTMASYEEVWQAAKDHIMQDANVADRLAYDLSNQADITYDNMAEAGFNRDIMIENLSKLGLEDKASLRNMSNDSLAEYYKRTMLIDKGIKGAVRKHSFIKEEVDVLSQTWDAYVAKARAAKVGTEESVRTYQFLEQATTTPYKLDIPADITMYTAMGNKINEQLGRVKAEQDLLYQKLQREVEPIDVNGQKVPLWQAYEQGLIDDATFKAKIVDTNAYTNYMNLRFQQQMLEDNKAVNDTYYYRAVRNVAERKGEQVPKFDVINTYTTLRSDPLIQQILSTNGFFGKPVKEISTKDKVRITDADGKVTERFYTAEDVAKYAEFKKAYDEYGSIFGNKYAGEIDAEMRMLHNNSTSNYSYTALATDGAGERSKWYKDVKLRLDDNINNFYLVNTDGRREDFNSGPTATQIKSHNLEPLGRTNQPVYNHDYGLYVKENMTKIVDGKEVPSGEPPRYHILIPTADPEFYAQASINAVQTGFAEVKGQQKTGYVVENPQQIAQIWALKDIDKQLATFQAVPEESGKSVTFPVTIGPRYKANVTRETLPTGNTRWSVQAVQIDPKTGQQAPVKNDRGGDITTYDNIYEVEWALEWMGGSGMKVPLKFLKSVDHNTFKNIEVDSEVSIPYLHSDFIRELHKLDEEIPVPIRFTGMSRTPEGNIKVGGVEKSMHLYGLGADFHLDDALNNWLIEHYNMQEGVSKQLPGTNLELLIHDAGTGKHLHVERTKFPDNIQRFTKLK